MDRYLYCTKVMGCPWKYLGGVLVQCAPSDFFYHAKFVADVLTNKQKLHIRDGGFGLLQAEQSSLDLDWFKTKSKVLVEQLFNDPRFVLDKVQLLRNSANWIAQLMDAIKSVGEAVFRNFTSSLWGRVQAVNCKKCVSAHYALVYRNCEKGMPVGLSQISFFRRLYWP